MLEINIPCKIGWNYKPNIIVGLFSVLLLVKLRLTNVSEWCSIEYGWLKWVMHLWNCKKKNCWASTCTCVHCNASHMARLQENFFSFTGAQTSSRDNFLLVCFSASKGRRGTYMLVMFLSVYHLWQQSVQFEGLDKAFMCWLCVLWSRIICRRVKWTEMYISTHVTMIYDLKK